MTSVLVKRIKITDVLCTEKGLGKKQEGSHLQASLGGKQSC